MATLYALLLCLLACSGQSAAVIDNVNETKSSCARGPVLSSLESILAQPSSVQLLLEAARSETNGTVYGTSLFAAVRHITRGEEGLPHVIEFTREQPDYGIISFSRPFVIGGVAWLIKAEPSLREPLGCSYFLLPVLGQHWDTSDRVRVTLDVSTPHGGQGFKARQGVTLTFSKNGQQGAPVSQLVAYLPSPIHETPLPRSTVLRINFSRVAPSWDTEDSEQTHTEAQYRRACKRHVEMLETAKLYGIQQRFRTAAMQHRVLLNASTVHNEYRWAGRTFWGIAELVVDLLTDNVRCHTGSVHVASAKVAAVMLMVAHKRKGHSNLSRILLDVIEDPTAEDGVRYIDAQDGEDLTRYGTECTAGSNGTAHQESNTCVAAEARKQEYEAFYDGLLDPTANNVTAHLERARAFLDIARSMMKTDVNVEEDWPQLWHKLRDAPNNRRALLGSVRAPQPPEGSQSCMERLPPEGPTQLFQWTIYTVAQPLEGIYYAQSMPFAACGLVWNALLTLDDVGLNMVLRPDGDLLRDIKAVRGTARYMLLSGHLKGTGVPTRTRGKGSFVADARSPTITLWSAPRGARLEQQLLLALRGSRSSGLVRLHIDASVEWHEGAKGPERALYEASYLQYMLIHVADYLEMTPRFLRTVRLGTVLTAPKGRGPVAEVTIHRRDKTYTIDSAHVLLDDLLYEHVLCLTGSKEIASTKRSAVYDMAFVRTSTFHWLHRLMHAPKVVMLHPDPAASSGAVATSTAGRNGNGQQRPSASTRYLDEYGHDVTPYFRECTTDLEGLEQQIAFGEDDPEDGSEEECMVLHSVAAASPVVAQGRSLLFWPGSFPVEDQGRPQVPANFVDHTAEAALAVACCLVLYLVLRWAPWGKGAKLAAQRARSSLPLRGRKATGAATGSLCSSPGGSSTCQPHPGIGSSSGGGGSSGSSTVRQESGGGRNGAGCGRRQGAKKPPPGRGKRRQEDQTPTKSGTASHAGGASSAQPRSDAGSPAQASYPTSVSSRASGGTSTTPGTPPHQPWSSTSTIGATSPTEPLVATPDTGAAKPQSLRQRLRLRLADLAGFSEGPVMAQEPLAGSAGSGAATAHDTATARAFAPRAGRPSGGSVDQRKGPESQEGRPLEQHEEQQRQQQQQPQGRRRDSSGAPGSFAPQGNSQRQGIAPAAEGPGVQRRRRSDSAGSAAFVGANEGREGGAPLDCPTPPAAAASASATAAATDGVNVESAGPLGPSSTAAAVQRVQQGPTRSTAAAAAPASAQPLSRAPADEEDEAVCLVCHDGPRQWGFLHGGSVHVGVCGGCREELERRGKQGSTCPVCREPVDAVIKLIQA